MSLAASSASTRASEKDISGGSSSAPALLAPLRLRAWRPLCWLLVAPLPPVGELAPPWLNAPYSLLRLSRAICSWLSSAHMYFSRSGKLHVSNEGMLNADAEALPVAPVRVPLRLPESEPPLWKLDRDWLTAFERSSVMSVKNL